MQFSSATPNAFCEPHGMPLPPSSGKPRIICKEEVATGGGETRLCNSEIGESGCGGRHVMMRRTPFVKRVATGEHAKSGAGLICRGL